ncbi:MAG: hypothetical protein QW270_00535 [Candidatus Bathyarchaeia archaeon]
MSMLDEVESEHVPRECLSRKCVALSEYFRESALRIDLERQNKKLKKQNALYRKAVDSLLASIKELLHPYYPAINLLRERLKEIPKVTQAYYFVTEEVINLWIITEEENFETEMKIIENLRELFSVFRNLLFDFMIIPRDDIPLEEIIPANSQLIFSRT